MESTGIIGKIYATRVSAIKHRGEKRDAIYVYDIMNKNLARQDTTTTKKKNEKTLPQKQDKRTSDSY
jgi:hypothetical protein